MTKIRITKLSSDQDNRFPPTSAGISTQTIWEGEHLPEFWPKPEVGRVFQISTYRTSTIQEIVSDSIFKTLNSTYKWEIIN